MSFIIHSKFNVLTLSRLLLGCFWLFVFKLKCVLFFGILLKIVTSHVEPRHKTQAKHNYYTGRNKNKATVKDLFRLLLHYLNRGNFSCDSNYTPPTFAKSFAESEKILPPCLRKVCFSSNIFDCMVVIEL